MKNRTKEVVKAELRAKKEEAELHLRNHINFDEDETGVYRWDHLLMPVNEDPS